jgi:ABC-type phosphate transport system substrate-binding protein
MALSTGAQAQVISGGGSTLIGPYVRIIENCYGIPENLIVQGSYPYGAGSESPLTQPSFNFPGVGAAHTGAQNCATTQISSTVQLNYVNSGSGNGELGVVTHDVGTDMGVTTDGGTNYPAQITSIQYGMGDYGLGNSEIAAYNCTGASSCALGQTTGASSSNTVHIIGTTDTTDTPSTLSPTSPTTSPTYANPTPLYGAFIQFPISIDAVAIAYSPIYKVVNNSLTGVNTYYSFNLHTHNADGSGGLKLDIPTVCAIFNGQITNWNDPALKALNGGVSLKAVADPTPASSWSVPIQLDGRADSSGTTSIFFRALAAQCGQTQAGQTVNTPATTSTGANITYTEAGDSYTYTNAFTAGGGKKLPSARIGSSVGQFHTYTGSTLVAAALGNIPTPSSGGTVLHGDLGYIGTDYVVPQTNSTTVVNASQDFNLNVADIARIGTTVYLEPTPANALKAFGTGATAILPPQSTASGVYSATVTTNGLRANPEDWAEPYSTYLPTLGGVTLTAGTVNTPLANPTATGAYPLVGTTNAFLNTCYAGTNAAAIKGFFTYYLTSTAVTQATTGLLNKAGFGVLPVAWRTAINQTFFNPTNVVTKHSVAKTLTHAAYTYNTDAGTGTLNLNVLAAGTAGTTYGDTTGSPPVVAPYVVGGQCASVSPGA